jgi:hypothetical protein
MNIIRRIPSGGVSLWINGVNGYTPPFSTPLKLGYGRGHVLMLVLAFLIEVPRIAVNSPIRHTRFSALMPDLCDGYFKNALGPLRQTIENNILLAFPQLL